MRKAAAGQPQDSQVGGGVIADQHRLMVLAVAEAGAQAAPGPDHVAVRDGVPVRREDDARSLPDRAVFGIERCDMDHGRPNPVERMRDLRGVWVEILGYHIERHGIDPFGPQLGCGARLRHPAIRRGRFPVNQPMLLSSGQSQSVPMHGGKADMDLIEQLAGALASRVAAAAPFVVAVRGGRRQCSGILWRPDVVVTSAQMLDDDPKLVVVAHGQQVEAILAGRDPGTNVAVLRLASSLAAAPLPLVGTCARSVRSR